MQLLWFANEACKNPAITGGKAATLARLAARYRVPAGFCIVFAVDDDPKVPSLQQEIREALNQLRSLHPAGNFGVAVRSSAIDEDGNQASFAGQHETYLNVTTLPDLLTAVEQCRQSVYSTQALAYRRNHGLPVDKIPFAVLVQQMIAAESSAVAFSIDPVQPNHNAIIINAHWGLGDRLVGGQSTPDHFVVSRDDLTLLGAQIAHKPWLTQLSASGVTTAAVADAQQHLPSLGAEQVTEIARLALQLENEMGWPVDLECAYQEQQLYLLQCRPITTLTPLTASPESNTPSGRTLDQDAWAVAWDQPADAEQSWFGGHDFVLPLQQSLSLYYYQGWAKAFRGLDVEGGLRARFVNGFEYRLWQWKPRHSAAMTEAAVCQRERDVPARWANEWLPMISADVTQWNQIALSTLTHDELARHLLTMLARQLEHWAIHAVMGDAPLSAVGRLVDWYLQRFPDAPESEPYRLVQGQANSSTEANHQLWQLAKLAERLQLLERLASNSDEQPDLPAEFQSALTDYCQHFGQLTNEQQQRTRHLIHSYARLHLPDPNAALTLLAAERETLIATVRAKLDGVERVTFDDLLHWALANNPLTESHNLYLDQMSNAATKRVLNEFAQRLHTAGILAELNEVDYLSLYELLEWGYGLGNPLRGLVAARKAEYAGYRQLTPPSFIGKAPPLPGEAGTDRFGGPSGPLASADGTIRGIGASAGVIAGRALVAQTLDEAILLQRGDILICRSSDPTWTPLFVIAGGLVTDFGGSLSHAAVVAREYRLPAVVGTHEATQKIVTGQWVEVDGVNGIVRI